MSKFTENLWRDLVEDHGATLAQARRPEHRSARWRRPQVVAGGTLGLAGAAAAVVLGLGLAGSPPAYAVTTNSNGSVTVQISETSSLPAANAKLTSMGVDEQVGIVMARGPATVPGPVSCTAGPGAGAPNPPVSVLVGDNGTEVISAGQSGGNTGEGTWHLASCTVAPTSSTGPGTGNTGNTGAA